MWTALRKLDYTKDNPQLWVYLRNCGTWAIKDEIRRRSAFYARKSRLLEHLLGKDELERKTDQTKLWQDDMNGFQSR